MDMSAKTEQQSAFEAAVRSYSEGRLDDALQQMNALLQANPQGAPRWFAVLGSIHLKQDNRGLAADAFVREARLNPAAAAAFLKHAVTLYHDLGAQEKLCNIAKWAIEILPGDNRVHAILVSALVESSRLDEAEPFLHLLDMSDPWQVSIVYMHHGGRRDSVKAFEVLKQGLVHSPEDAFLLSNYYADARNILDFEIMRDYDAIMQAMDLPRAKLLLQVERALNRLYWTTSEALTAAPCMETLQLKATTAHHRVLPRRTFSRAGQKIHIGYLSNDFYDHVVMKVLMPILMRHDLSKFEFTLFCYTKPAIAVAQQNWPERLRQRIVSIHDLSSPEAVKVISDHAIDILVDLKGHTHAARLDMVNLSDAPLKVGYLGFPSTVVGADLDYAITDHHITPDVSKLYWHEKLCRLPGSLMPNRPLEETGPTSTTREAWGLPADKFVFCSFNGIHKLSLRTISLWARILAALPDACLWVRCDLEIARENLKKELLAHGVTEDQIVFAPGVGQETDHIARLALGDLALDPTPYNGHVTTADTLRAGLPVLGLRGTTCSSRMSVGQLSALDLPELIAESEDDYVARAVELATDRQQLSAIKEKLLVNRQTMPLFNADLYTQHLERAFELMADRARAGLPPDHIDVPAIG